MATHRHHHLVWDWNGTVVDDTDLCVEIVNEELAGLGLPPIDATIFRREITFPIFGFYARIGIPPDIAGGYPAVAERFTETYFNRASACRLQPGVLELMDLASAAGWTHSVLSAYSAPHLEADARRFGLESRFRWIVGAQTPHGGGKTANARLWLASTELSPEAVTLIGDTVHDAEVAEALGFGCVLISRGHQSHELLAATGRPVAACAHEAAALLALASAGR